MFQTEQKQTADQPLIPVSVRLFAAARDAVRDELIQLDLPAEATIDTLRKSLVERFPKLQKFGSHLLFAIGTDYAGSDRALSAGDEIACFPPVSGG